jgi:hypothetical protein
MWIKYSDGDILSTAGDALTSATLTSDASGDKPYFKGPSNTLETHQRQSWRQSSIDYMPTFLCFTPALTNVGLNILEFAMKKTFNI